MKRPSFSSSFRPFIAVFGLILLVSLSGCYSTGANSQLSGYTPFQPRSFSQQVSQPQNYQPHFAGFHQPQASQQSFQVQSFQGSGSRPAPQSFANQNSGQSGFSFLNPFAKKPATQVGFQGGFNPFGGGSC